MNYLSNHLARRLPFFYGYLMLPIAMLMQIGTSPGQTFAVSAFTPSLLAALDLSQSRLGLAYMLGTMAAAIPLSLIGPLADRHGLRRVSTLVIAALAGACFFASTINGFLSLLAAFFLLRFLGQGSLSLLSSNTTAMWFRNRIGRVSALLSAGSAIAFAFIPEWLAVSIDAIGWRATYQAIALVLVASLLPLVLLFYRNRPEDLGQTVDGIEWEPRPTSTAAMAAAPKIDPAEEDLDAESFTLKQACRTFAYYILGASNIVWAMAGTGVLFYLFTLCEERGLPDGTAASVFKILGVTMLTAQLGGGILGDFLPLGRLYGLGTSMVAASLLWLTFDVSVVGTRAFAALFGAGQGMLVAISGIAWVRYYGRKHLGAIRGAVWCGTVAGSGCGPFIMGTVKDLTGNYDAAVLLFGCLMTPLAVAGWFIRPPRT